MASNQTANLDSARIVSIVLGVWLFISAFIWPHNSALMHDTWICGVLAVIFAAISLRVAQVRYLNTVLAIWLFITAFGFTSQSVGTIWNNVLVAIALFICSLVGRDTHSRLVEPHPA